MSTERKQAIESALKRKGFKTKETDIGIIIRGQGKKHYNPMDGKSRNLVTIGGISEQSTLIRLFDLPDGMEPDLVNDEEQESKSEDMKLGIILTVEQELTERADWDTYGRECRETSDKYDGANHIC